MKKLIAVGMAALLGAFVANADLVTYDFTSVEYKVLSGQTSYTIDNAQGEGIDLSFTTGNSNKKISWNTNASTSRDRSGNDGLGVYTVGSFDDEITGGTVCNYEMLTISFEPGVTLNQIMVTDLFIEGSPQYAEVGLYRVKEDVWVTNWVPFTAVQKTGTNGELTIDVSSLGYDDVSKISFKAQTGSKNDFSVRGLVVSVPEPGTLSLLGLGLGCLMGLAGIRRKR